MKKIGSVLLVAVTLALAGCTSSAEKLNNDGNEALAAQDYETALAAYQQVEDQLPELAEPHYNAAIAQYRQEKFDDARQEIEQALVKDDGELASNSFYNLGNSFYLSEDYEQAVESYQETLRLNPDDVEAKHNLELALQQLQQPPEQEQQQDQQDQDQNGENSQSDDQQAGESNSDNTSDEPQDNSDQSESQPEDQTGDEQSDEQSSDQTDDSSQDEPQDESQPGDQQPEDSSDGDGEPQDPADAAAQARGQPGEPTDDQADGQPAQVIEGLSQEQAKQLFEAATRGTESLEEYLQQVLVVPGGQPAEDW